MNDYYKQERRKTEELKFEDCARAVRKLEVAVDLYLGDLKEKLDAFLGAFRNVRKKPVNQIKANNIEEFLEQKKCKEPFYKNANGKKKHWE